MQKTTGLLVTIIIFPCIFSFSQIAVGQWRDHLPYSHATGVTDAGSKVYCITDISCFSYNKNDNSVEKMSKATGLSDVGFSTVGYNSEYDVLIIGYTNGNIDLISNNTIFNISDIKRKQMIGGKSVNDIFFRGSKAYLSCSFGIVVLDILNKEIKDTYIIGENASELNINEIAFDTQNELIYAATSEGIYKANINHPNLLDYRNWERLSGIPNYNKAFNTIEYFNGKIFYNYPHENFGKDTIYIWDGTGWAYFDSTYLFPNHAIYSTPEYLYLASDYQVNKFDSSLNRIEIIWSYGNITGLYSRDVTVDENGILWVADDKNGLVKYPGFNSAERIFPDGPLTNRVASMSMDNSQLWVAAGSKISNAVYYNNWYRAEAYSFINESWNTYNSDDFPALNGISDLANITIDPQNTNHVFFGTIGRGIFEYLNGTIINHYTDSNSTLQNIEPFTEGFIRINHMAFDEQNRLWVSNTDIKQPISVLSDDNNWYNFDYSEVKNIFTGQILITQNNNKWMVLPKGNGIFVFNENGTFDDQDDDDKTQFGVLDEDKQLITNEIYTLAEDEDGYIWVGTNKGVVVYYSPENVFTGDNFYAQQIILDLDGSAQYLLETEIVTSIAIDGGNRKWFGTQSAGTFLMSPDGTEQISAFNKDNSPLLSNTIIDIEIDHNSGEVFFATDKGIISYRGTATKGDENFEQVLVYPNPVRENYTGPIAIKGLVANANVKITDISGNIVYETTAIGGQAIWYGKNFSGKKVQTGVYLVFVSNEDGSKTYITKLLFIN